MNYGQIKQNLEDLIEATTNVWLDGGTGREWPARGRCDVLPVIDATTSREIRNQRIVVLANGDGELARYLWKYLDGAKPFCVAIEKTKEGAA